MAGAVWRPGIYELKEESNLGEVVELSGGFQPDSMQDCILLERLNSFGKELKPVLHHPDFLQAPIYNFDVIKIYPNGTMMPKYFYPKVGDANVVSQAD